MKRIILTLVCVVSLQAIAWADNDKPVTVEQLPATAQQFIQKYFADSKVSYAKMENELFDKSYEVIFVNGNKVEFDKKGNWKDVDCKFTEVPADIVPLQIRNYIAANHSDFKIVDIDRDSRDYEVKLSNDLELKFDLKFNIIGIDD